MVYTATASTSTTPSSNPSAQAVKGNPNPTLDSTLQAALEHARRLTEMFGVANPETAIAWETVEEIRSARARSTSTTVTPRAAFMRYCEENPNAFEARIYDC